MSIHGSIEPDRRLPDRQAGERDVRLMLHRVRKPDELAANPLAQAICSALGSRDAQAAIRRVVDEAFGGESHDDVAMRRLVLACDIDGTLSLAEACRAFSYSRRHFQRYRAQAVAIIARYIERLLDPSYADGPVVRPLEALADVLSDRDPVAAVRVYGLEREPAPIKSELQRLHARVRAGEILDRSAIGAAASIHETLALAIAAQSQELAGNTSEVNDLLSQLHYEAAHVAAPFDTMTCFELEWLRSLQALHRSDSRALEAAARALARLATDKLSLKPRASLAAARAAVRSGNLLDAAHVVRDCTFAAHHERNVERFASALVVQAEIDLLSGDAIHAVDNATASAIALEKDIHAALGAQAIVGRAMLAQRRRWSAPDVSRAPRTAWSRLAVEAVQARQEQALPLARSIYHLAQHLGYAGISAYAAATLAVYDAREGSAWRTRAFTDFARTGDHLVAFDLFVFTQPAPMDLDDDLVEIMLERIDVIVPQLRGDSAAQRDEVRRFVRTLCSFVLQTCALSELEAQAEELNRSNSALTHYFAKASALLENALGVHLRALAPFLMRESVARRLTEAMHALESRVHPGEKRAFPVG